MHSQIFNEIDADGNGYITPDEVIVGFGKMGVTLTLDDAKAIVSEADTNKDGRISYDGKKRVKKCNSWPTTSRGENGPLQIILSLRSSLGRAGLIKVCMKSIPPTLAMINFIHPLHRWVGGCVRIHCTFHV